MFNHKATVPLRLAMMVVLLFAWPAMLLWLLTGTRLSDHPTLLFMFSSILICATLLVVFGSQWWARWLFQPRRLAPDSAERFAFVSRMVQQQAAILGIPRPVLHVYENEAPNAFIVGGAWRQQHLYFSEALVEQMSHGEIEAVIAHELAHIYHRDIVMNEVFFGLVAGPLYLLQHTVGWSLAILVQATDRIEFAKKTAMWLSYGGLLLPVWLFMLFYSRRNEYRADALASQLVGHEQFVWMLQRLRVVCRDSVFSLDEPTMLRRFFTTHPPLHHRIHALEARQQA